MSNVRMVEVYRARDSTHAHLLRDQLEEAGIPTFIEGMQLQSALGGLPTGWAVAPRLVIEAQHAGQARALLEQLEALGRGNVDGDDSENQSPADSSESHTAQMPRRTCRPVGSPGGILRWYGHLLGVFTILWAAASWVEWFAVPILAPDRGGPVPWLDFAFLSLLFMFGCLWLTLQMLLFPMPLSWRSRLIYAAFPASYLLYILSQFVRG